MCVYYYYLFSKIAAIYGVTQLYYQATRCRCSHTDAGLAFNCLVWGRVNYAAGFSDRRLLIR